MYCLAAKLIFGVALVSTDVNNWIAKMAIIYVIGCHVASFFWRHVILSKDGGHWYSNSAIHCNVCTTLILWNEEIYGQDVGCESWNDSIFRAEKKTARWSLLNSSGLQRHIHTERCRVSKRFSIRFIHPLLFNEIEINILIRASCRENWTGSNLWLPFGNESGEKWFRFRRKWSMSTPKRFLSAVDQLLRLGFIKIHRNSGSSKTFTCLLRPTWNFSACQ